FREKGLDPHLLLTTATPIPQTLSQTVYRDLDISVLDEMPSGRQSIRTEVRPHDALPKVWPWVRQRVALGEQAFVVTPRIEEDPEDDVPSAEATFRDLAAKDLAGLRLALLHGRMPARERDEVMRRFADREIDVIVATTVVEVGIDIPNATVMVVLGAERFGLAQLHQLRGRVGRRGQGTHARRAPWRRHARRDRPHPRDPLRDPRATARGRPRPRSLRGRGLAGHRSALARCGRGHVRRARPRGAEGATAEP